MFDVFRTVVQEKRTVGGQNKRVNVNNLVQLLACWQVKKNIVKR